LTADFDKSDKSICEGEITPDADPIGLGKYDNETARTFALSSVA